MKLDGYELSSAENMPKGRAWIPHTKKKQVLMNPEDLRELESCDTEEEREIVLRTIRFWGMVPR